MYQRSDVSNEITYPLRNFNSPTIEIWNVWVVSSHALLGMWLILHLPGVNILTQNELPLSENIFYIMQFYITIWLITYYLIPAKSRRLILSHLN